MKTIIFAAALVVSGAFALPVAGHADELDISTLSATGWTYSTDRENGPYTAATLGAAQGGSPNSITPGTDTPAFWVAQYSFQLATLDGASLLLKWLGGDDRLALMINGVFIGGTGVENTTVYNYAKFQYDNGTPLSYLYDATYDSVLVHHKTGVAFGFDTFVDDYFGKNGTYFQGIETLITGALKVGTNVIELIVNNTLPVDGNFDPYAGGWGGNPVAGSPTWAAFSATLTFQQAVPVPAPVAGASLPAALLLGGLWLYRRRVPTAA